MGFTTLPELTVLQNDQKCQSIRDGDQTLLLFSCTNFVRSSVSQIPLYLTMDLSSRQMILRCSLNNLQLTISQRRFPIQV